MMHSIGYLIGEVHHKLEHVQRMICANKAEMHRLDHNMLCTTESINETITKHMAMLQCRGEWLRGHSESIAQLKMEALSNHVKKLEKLATNLESVLANAQSADWSPSMRSEINRALSEAGDIVMPEKGNMKFEANNESLADTIISFGEIDTSYDSANDDEMLGVTYDAEPDAVPGDVAVSDDGISIVDNLIEMQVKSVEMQYMAPLAIQYDDCSSSVEGYVKVEAEKLSNEELVQESCNGYAWLRSSTGKKMEAESQASVFAELDGLVRWLRRHGDLPSQLSELKSEEEVPANNKVADWLLGQGKSDHSHWLKKPMLSSRRDPPVRDDQMCASTWLRATSPSSSVACSSISKAVELMSLTDVGGHPNQPREHNLIDTHMLPDDGWLVDRSICLKPENDLSSTDAPWSSDVWLALEKCDQEKMIIDPLFAPDIAQYCSVLTRPDHDFLFESVGSPMACSGSANFASVLDQVTAIQSSTTDQFLVHSAKRKRAGKMVDPSLCQWLISDTNDRCSDCPGSCLYDDFDGSKQWLKTATDW